jgi:suppressor for copper-sensitivity B
MARVMTRTVHPLPGALLSAVLCAGFAGTAFGQAGTRHETDRGTVRLVAGVRDGSGQSLLLGVELALKWGWKTYWRQPGLGGYPPQFDWTGSGNIAAPQVLWPRPERLDVSGIATLGYRGRVILPVRVRLLSPDKDTELRLRISYAACREVCVPEEARLRLRMPAGAARRGPHAAEIERFALMTPHSPAAFGWKLEYAGFNVDRAGGEPRASFAAILLARRERFEAPELIVEGEHTEYLGRTAGQVAEGGRRAHFMLYPPERALSAEPRQLTLTLLDRGRYAALTVQLGGPKH